MRIEFVIDELVLVGFDPRDRHRIADAVARSLEMRATAADVLPLLRAGGVSPVVRGADVVFPRSAAGVPSSAVGTGVGESILKGLAAVPIGQRGGK